MTETQTTNDTTPQQTAVLQKDPGPLPGLIHTLREQQQREKSEKRDREKSS